MTTAHLTPVGPSKNRRSPDVGALVRRLTGVLESAAVRVRGAQDPDAIHDLRVACRRLSSALSAWEHGLEPEACRAAQRGLRDLRRRLSRAREREVLAEQFAELFANESLTVREAGIAELERLERRVVQDRARAAGVVRRRRVAQLVTGVEACVATIAPDSSLLAPIQAGADARRRAALDALATAAEGDDALHRARIAVKRWRYHLEAMGAPSGSGASPEALGPLRDLQQCLGAIHDAAVLRDFISRRAWRARAKGRDARHEALVLLGERAVRARWQALERLASAATNAGAMPRP
jgi:CHAD domain-containing protein